LCGLHFGDCGTIARYVFRIGDVLTAALFSYAFYDVATFGFYVYVFPFHFVVCFSLLTAHFFAKASQCAG
jgi:hypothetical protein